MDLTGAWPRDPELTYCDAPHPENPEVRCTKEVEQGGSHMGYHFVLGTQVTWPGRGLLAKPERDKVKGEVRDGIDNDPATPPPTSSEVLPPRPHDSAVKAGDREVIDSIYASWDAKEATRHWIDTAIPVAQQVCLEREEVTTDHWWPLLNFPNFVDSDAGGRIIGRIVSHALKQNWMERWMMDDGSMRGYPSDILPVVYSLDGVRIMHQKIVPIYRSLLYRDTPLVVAGLRDFG
jgi:hypothetical protein